MSKLVSIFHPGVADQTTRQTQWSDLKYGGTSKCILVMVIHHFIATQLLSALPHRRNLISSSTFAVMHL